MLAFGVNADCQDGRIAALHEGSIAWVEPDLVGELEREYEQDELARIEGLIGDWDGFGVDYRSVEAADAVVAAVCARWPCAVDDDAGFIGPGVEYLALNSIRSRRPEELG
ncbi:hypothetical protein GCM10017557_51000 [Streptomyces aurantiacus]|uniref:Uncharacterized protein n=1 Tax=Streptomyces aurantiacus TaxID=47760 RepID=A0A7G1P6H8_9ACTN|nr:hypothetical protein GCM10017557_51000 [Streptomyces aurantiacus]